MVKRGTAKCLPLRESSTTERPPPSSAPQREYRRASLVQGLLHARLHLAQLLVLLRRQPGRARAQGDEGEHVPQELVHALGPLLSQRRRCECQVWLGCLQRRGPCVQERGFEGMPSSRPVSSCCLRRRFLRVPRPASLRSRSALRWLPWQHTRLRPPRRPPLRPTHEACSARNGSLAATKPLMPPLVSPLTPTPLPSRGKRARAWEEARAGGRGAGRRRRRRGREGRARGAARRGGCSGR